MTRQRKMIELVLRDLRDAATSADRSIWYERDEHKARIVLACAVDSALADLDHALSTAPCNHGACKGTTIDAVNTAPSERSEILDGLLHGGGL